MQGEYCLQVKMDIIPGSGVVAVGAQTVQVPSTPQSVARQVWYTNPTAAYPTAPAYCLQHLLIN
jgi:hypothetical protein